MRRRLVPLLVLFAGCSPSNRTPSDGATADGTPSDGLTPIDAAADAAIAPMPDAKAPTHWSADITTSTTWTEAMCPMIVDSDVRVGEIGAPQPVVLTIEAGCEVRFDTIAGLTVVDNGAIHAIGTEEQPITLTNTALQNAFLWRGIYMLAPSTVVDTQLEHVTIEDVVGGIAIANGRPILKSVTIRGGSGDGILIATSAGSGFGAGSVGVAVTQKPGFGVVTDLDKLEEIPPGSDFSGNTRGGVKVRGTTVATVTRSMTWKNVVGTYVLANGLAIEGATSPILTLDAGAAIATTAVTIGTANPGGLRALGTAALPVTFQSVDQSAFEGILFRNSTIDASSELTHVTINSPVSTGIVLNDASPLLRNVTVDASAYGLLIRGASTLAAGSTDLHIRGGTASVEAGPVTIQTLPIQGSDYGGTSARFWIRGENVPVSGRWLNYGPTYHVQGVIHIGAVGSTPELTIDPGITLELAEQAGIAIGENTGGGLLAQGTAAQPITFTGASWGGLAFRRNTTATSKLAHVVVDGGGNAPFSDASPANIFIEAASPSLQDVIVRRSHAWGIITSCFGHSGPPAMTNVTYGSGAEANASGNLYSVGC